MPKHQTMHAAAELHHPVVLFSGALARALGDDPIAALLLCQLWYLSASGTRRVSTTAAALHHSTGINAARQRRAREALTAAKLVSEDHNRDGNGALHVHFNVHRDSIVALLRASAPTAETEQGPSAETDQGVEGPSAETLLGKPHILRTIHTQGEIVGVVPIQQSNSLSSTSRSKKEKTKTPEPQPAAALVLHEPQPAARAKAKKARGPWRVVLDEQSGAVARAALEGKTPHNPAGSSTREETMVALATVRALRWGHPTASYSLEDCQHVAALTSAGYSVAQLASALVGAWRKPYWRERGVSMRDVRNHVDEFIAESQKQSAPRSTSKAEAIEAWRRAYDALPIGLRLDHQEAPDFTHMTADQIALGAVDMMKQAHAASAQPQTLLGDG